MRVFPVKKLPFAALLWISSPNKKYPITVAFSRQRACVRVRACLSIGHTFMSVWADVVRKLQLPSQCNVNLCSYTLEEADCFLFYCKTTSSQSLEIKGPSTKLLCPGLVIQTWLEFAWQLLHGNPRRWTQEPSDNQRQASQIEPHVKSKRGFRNRIQNPRAKLGEETQRRDHPINGHK